MDGIGNKAGWSWIFIIEGLFTFAFGVATFFLLPRTPSHARFLSTEEKEYIVETLKEDGATGKDEASDAFSWREVRMAFKLPQVWMLAIIFFLDGMCLDVLLGSAQKLKQRLFAAFSGTILYGLA